MKTKPFNLILALEGDQVVTRDGRKVLELHLFKSKTDFPLIALIAGEEGHSIETYTEDGRWSNHPGEDESDLLMLITPLKKSCWVNIYKYGRIEGGFESQKEADDQYEEYYLNKIGNPRVACIQIEWEE